MKKFAITVLGLALCAMAQDGGAAVARAKAIEDYEGDLKTAAAEYRKLLASEDAAPMHAEAALRLGRLLWRLEQKDEAKPWLERAVAAGGEWGKQAAAVLAGQGPEGQQAQDVAAKAAQAIERLFDGYNQAEQDLVWLGQAAVPEVVRRLDQSRAEAMAFLVGATPVEGVWMLAARTNVNQMQGKEKAFFAARTLARLLWSLGGVEAERYLRAGAADQALDWRRMLARDSQYAADSLLLVAEKMLQDADPLGLAPGWVLARLQDRLPVASIAALRASPVEAVRQAAWDALCRLQVWSTGASGREDAYTVIEPWLVQRLGDGDPAIARGAFEFLGRAGGTARGAELFFSWLPRVPVFQQAAVRTPSLAVVLRAAKELGAVGTADGKAKHRDFVAGHAWTAINRDPERTTTQICDLIELGYDQPQSALFAAHAVTAAAGEADLLRVTQLLDRCRRADQAALELGKRDLPAAAAEPIARRLQAVLQLVPSEGSKPPVRQGPRPNQPNRPQPNIQTDEQQQFANEATYLFYALGRTGSPTAVATLRALLQSRPDWGDNGVGSAALLLAEKSAAPEVSALLRELLVSTAIDTHMRNLVFGTLAGRGDVEAIALFPQAYELGLTRSTREQLKVNRPLKGVQWLGEVVESTSETGQQQIRKLYAYTDADLVRAWKLLLASKERKQVLADADSESQCPPAAHLVLAQAAQANPELVIDDQRFQLARLASRATTLDSGAEYRAVIASLAANPDWGHRVLEGIPEEVCKLMQATLRGLLAGPNSYYALKALKRGGVTLTKDDLLACLRSDGNRYALIAELPPDTPPEIVRQVEALLPDASDDLRKQICDALGRFLDAGSVAALLPLLRDRNGTVVTAANEALSRIRLYHEQKVFWEQFQQGVSTGREAATAKLLIQAKPDNPKGQRILALRSLAALGAPEALPYLIDWSTDKDAEIAQATREAIARIHQQAGVK